MNKPAMSSDPLAYRCPRCWAAPGDRCTVADPDSERYDQPGRLHAARAELGRTAPTATGLVREYVEAMDGATVVPMLPGVRHLRAVR